MINLHLEWREVLWWMQGGMAGSHLRWSVYEDMVNKVWPQCTEQERRNIHYIMERDFGTYWRNSDGDWKPESEIPEGQPVNRDTLYELINRERDEKHKTGNVIAWSKIETE